MADEPASTPGDLVEWGADDERRGPSRIDTLLTRLRLTGFQPRRLRSTRRRLAGLADRPTEALVRTVAATGAVLAGLSLVNGWQTTYITGDGADGTVVVTTLAGLEAWGSGYLFGLLGLFALTANALFGPIEQRPRLRMIGLGWSAGLIGVLIAITVNLASTSIVLRYSFFLGGGGPTFELAYGPGVFLAIAGVAGMGAAIWPRGRHVQLPHVAAGSTVEAPQDPSVSRKPATPPHIQPPGQPPGPVPRTSGPAPRTPGPIDLTVAPATPFIHLPDPPSDSPDGPYRPDGPRRQ